MKMDLALSATAQIPVMIDGEASEMAIVDREDYDRINLYQWCATRKTYRGWPHTDRTVDGKRLPKVLLMHKEVLGIADFDGRSNKMMAKDGNKFNCTKANIVKYVAEKGRKFFPKTKENFINYVANNHPGTTIYNLLKEAEIESFSRKQVVLALESDTKSDRLRLQNYLQEYLAEEFNFKGTVGIYIQKAPEQVAVALKEVPQPVAQTLPVAAPVAAPSAPPAQVSLPRSLDAGPFSLDVRALGLGNIKPTEPIVVEEFSTKLRQGKLRHIFSYRCEEVSEEKVQ